MKQRKTREAVAPNFSADGGGEDEAVDRYRSSEGGRERGRDREEEIDN